LNVFTAAQSGADTGTIATGGLWIVPHHSFNSAPSINLLVVPGGFGTRSLLNNQDVIAWIANTAALAQRVTSVCTGELLLAKAGLLSGKQATTHWGAYDALAKVDGTIGVDRGARVVETEDGVITSAGVAAGIDMAFSVVESLFRREVADDTARYINYPQTQHRNITGTGKKNAPLSRPAKKQKYQEPTLRHPSGPSSPCRPMNNVFAQYLLPTFTFIIRRDSMTQATP